MKKIIFVLGVLLLGVFGITFTTAESKPPEKITICHIPPGNPENAHAITISVNALEAHLAHGDVIGDCSQPAGITNENDIPEAKESGKTPQ